MFRTIMVSMWVVMFGGTATVYGQEAGAAAKEQIEAPDEKRSVTFARTDLTAGERRIKSDTMEFELKIEVKPPEGEPEFLHQRVTEITVVDEKVIEGSADTRKLEVFFRSVSKTEKRTSNDKDSVLLPEGGEKKVNLPVEGKTYLVTWTKKAGVSVTGVDGATVSEEEESVVLDEYKSLGDSSNFPRFIDGKTLVVGERLDMSPAVMAGFMKEEAEGTKQIAKGSALFKELRIVGKQEVAVFEFQIAMTRTEGVAPNWMETEFNLGGEVSIRLDGLRMLEMKMDGPVKFKGESMAPGGVKIKLRGKGAIRGKGVKTYL